jgi:hypothetical protein
MHPGKAREAAPSELHYLVQSVAFGALLLEEATLFGELPAFQAFWRGKSCAKSTPKQAT